MHVGYDPRNETELKLDEHAFRKLLIDATFMGLGRFQQRDSLQMLVRGELS